jgi:hypothetical protein
MESTRVCPECGAAWPDEQTCQDCFHQMLFWETERPADGAEVHHLMVLCYYLQHPSLYSPESLREAMRLLSDFLEGGVTPQQARGRGRSRLDSGSRQWKIKGTLDAHGSFPRPIQWEMTACDVIAGGQDGYCASVRRWAESILRGLRENGCLMN